MIYVFLDTSIWIRGYTQGLPGCEMEHFAALKKQVESRDVTLLVPEVIELELEKNWLAFPKILSDKIGELSKAIKELKTPWNEITDIKNSVTSYLGQQRTKMEKEATDRYPKLAELLSLPAVKRLPLTTEIMLSLKRRCIAGKMRHPERKQESDYLIIETLATFFASAGDPKAILYFCSENTADFGLELEKKWTLHPDLKDGLPTSEFFLDLAAMVVFAKKHKKPVEPSDAKVADALAKEMARRKAVDRNLEEFRCHWKNVILPGLQLLPPALGQRALLEALQPIWPGQNALLQALYATSLGHYEPGELFKKLNQMKEEEASPPPANITPQPPKKVDDTEPNPDEKPT